MEPVHYYFDESGEKGFIGPNFSPLDIGLIAGIALPARLVPTFERECSRILSGLDCQEVQKQHASALFNDGKNQDIKKEILNFLKNTEELLLIYEAMYPLGFYKYEKSTQEILSKHKPTNPRVKVSGNQSQKRIYTELLKGIILRLDEVCRIENSTDIRMISDRLDKGLLNEALNTLYYLQQKVHVQGVGGFDTMTKRVVHGSIESSIEGFDTTVRYISDILTETTQSPLTIVADIVSNTLYRHLKFVVEKENSTRLHSNSAIDGFILKEKIAFIDDCYLMDTLYVP